MLETILDSEIFFDFCKSQPATMPFETEKESMDWLLFWSFLKSGTNLKFIENDNFNGQRAESRFLTALTSGRGDAKLNFVQKFNWPHKNILPKETYPGSFFCLKQNDLIKRDQITGNNGMLFGFEDNYLHQYKKLAFDGKSYTTFHVRKELSGLRFLKRWEDLKQFILPFTDLIISDRYISDFSIIDQNLVDFICLLDKQTPVQYNLLIITQKGNKDFLDEFEHYLTDKIKENKLKARLGIVLTRKEHDRCILMNYLKIESGDSFNYFSKEGKIITNGTELKLFPLCFPDTFYDIQVKLSVIKNIVETEKEDIRGNLNNRLFRYCDDLSFKQ